jgi:hypothetical protein
VITTDHGRGTGPTAWRDHGKDIEGAQDVWAAIAGPDVIRRGEWRNTPPMYQNQIAATIASLWASITSASSPPPAPLSLN